MFLVITLHFRRRKNRVRFHGALAHCLDDHLVRLHLAKALERVALGLQGADEREAVALELFADDGVDVVIHGVFRDIEFVLLKILQNELAVDEFVDGRQPGFLDFIFKLLPMEGLAQRHFTGDHQFADLGKGDDLPVHHCGDSIEDLLLGQDGK